MGKFFKASGVPWTGEKRTGKYSYYEFGTGERGIKVSRTGIAYDPRDTGWRVLNKRPSRRARHRAAVAALVNQA